jgi:hypothetical protein
MWNSKPSAISATPTRIRKDSASIFRSGWRVDELADRVGGEQHDRHRHQDGGDHDRDVVGHAHGGDHRVEREHDVDHRDLAMAPQ